MSLTVPNTSVSHERLPFSAYGGPRTTTIRFRRHCQVVGLEGITQSILFVYPPSMYMLLNFSNTTWEARSEQNCSSIKSLSLVENIKILIFATARRRVDINTDSKTIISACRLMWRMMCGTNFVALDHSVSHDVCRTLTAGVAWITVTPVRVSRIVYGNINNNSNNTTRRSRQAFSYLCNSRSCGPFISNHPQTLVSPLIIAAVPGATCGGAGGSGTGLFQNVRLAIATSCVCRSRPLIGQRRVAWALEHERGKRKGTRVRQTESSREVVGTMKRPAILYKYAQVKRGVEQEA